MNINAITFDITSMINKIGLVAIAAIIMLFCGCKLTSSTAGAEQKDTNSIAGLKQSVSVVIFGMEKSSAGNCPGSELDARRFKELMAKYGYANNTQMFLNNQGTIANFEQYVSKAVKSDLAIIYYSGHGGSDDYHRLGNGANEEDGVDEFLCLYDGYYIDDKIWDIVSKSNGRVFMIFDCCHSKTMFRSPPMDEFTGLMGAGTDGGSGFSLLVWSGCPDNTYSYGSNEGGFFTSTMLKYWKSGISYEQLWKLISSDEALKKAQICQQTQIGTEWDANNEAFK